MRPDRPRPIVPDDPVDAFDCGNSVLSSWLADRALRNERSGDSRTYVSIDLVADAIANAQVAAQVLGARALVAEALDEDAERFYEHLGFWRSEVRRDLFAIRLGR